jgi:hypothetical protein
MTGGKNNINTANGTPDATSTEEALREARSIIESATATAGVPASTTVAPEATAENAEQGNTLFLSNWSEALSELERYKAEGDSKFLSEYINDQPESLPLGVKLGIIRVLQRTESENVDQAFTSRLTELESYFERQILYTNQNPNTPLSAIPSTEALDSDFEAILSQLKDRNAQLRDSRQEYGAVGITNRVGDGIAWGASGALDLFRNMATPAQLGTVALAIFLLYKAVSSSGVRNFLFTAGGILGVGYLLNEGLRAGTGRGTLEHLDSWMQRRNNELMEYYGINKDVEDQVKSFDMLMESILNDNEFGKNSFQDVVLAHQSSRNGRMPDTILNGVEFATETNPELAAVIMHRSVGIIVRKYGPESNMYRGNPKIKELYDRLMRGDVSWTEGVMNLLATDENAPRDMLPTIPETFGFVASNAYEVVAGTAGAITGAAISAIPDSWTGKFAEYKQKAEDSFSDYIMEDSAGLARVFNRRISNLNEIQQFEHQLGTFAYAALNSENNIYKEASGITYGTYKTALTAEQFSSNTARTEILSTQLQAFIEQMEQTEDMPLDGEFEFVFGAEMPGEAGAGDYIVSFAYVPKNHPQSGDVLMSPGIHNPELLNNVYDFKLNAYELAYAKEYFQFENYAEMNLILNYLRANHIPEGTALADIPNLLFSETARTAVATRLGRPLDVERWNYFVDLQEMNQEIAGSDAAKGLSLNALLVYVAQNDTNYLRSLGFASSYLTDEFKAEYRNYAESL